jgi:hypothetical protein
MAEQRVAVNVTRPLEDDRRLQAAGIAVIRFAPEEVDEAPLKAAAWVIQHAEHLLYQSRPCICMKSVAPPAALG